MSFQFNQPSGNGGYFKPAKANGHLVLILDVYSIDTRFDSMKGGDAPIATVDLVDLDEPGQELRERCWITHEGILNKFAVGDRMVLGRIGQVPTKNGNQAWVLGAFNEDVDGHRAGAWMDARSRLGITQPAPQAAPAATPAPAPVQQQAPAPAPQAAPMADPNDPAVQALLASLQQQK